MLSERQKLVLVFLMGAALRLLYVWHPVDRPLWREADEAAIARNYDREGLDILYPRIDWRGTAPGYAEMEFPAYPYSVALLYRAFGVHEWFGRGVSFLLSLVAMGAFFALARRLLPVRGALLACLFYALSWLVVFISHSLQPEGLMFASELVAVWAFLDWLDTNRWRSYWILTGATALAILAKAPAAHIGLFFVLMLLWKRRLRWLTDYRLWLFGLLTLAPAALWYRHARGFWQMYGLSLGVSNQTHWAGLDLLRDPRILTGVIGWDVWLAWTVAGALLCAYGLWRSRREPVALIALLWLAAVACYYLLAARTLASPWASYYHVVAVPPIALLFGLGAMQVRGVVLALGLAVVALQQARGIVKDVYLIVGQDLYACAREFKPAMTKPGLILASGGPCRERAGHPVAYNASYFFYWLDRKGWNVCEEEQSLAAVQSYTNQGAVYFVAEKETVALKPGFEQQLKAAYPVAHECPSAWLFQLR